MHRYRGIHDETIVIPPVHVHIQPTHLIVKHAMIHGSTYAKSLLWSCVVVLPMCAESEKKKKIVQDVRKRCLVKQNKQAGNIQKGEARGLCR
jgi:hypothetical protein